MAHLRLVVSNDGPAAPVARVPAGLSKAARAIRRGVTYASMDDTVYEMTPTCRKITLKLNRGAGHTNQLQLVWNDQDWTVNEITQYLANRFTVSHGDVITDSRAAFIINSFFFRSKNHASN